MVADEVPPVWLPSLPDLKTRLAITPVVRLGHPDDALFAALIQLHFADRGLHDPGEVAQPAVYLAQAALAVNVVGILRPVAKRRRP